MKMNECEGKYILVYKKKSDKYTTRYIVKYEGRKKNGEMAEYVDSVYVEGD